MQRHAVFCAQFRRHDRERAVNALQPLEVDFETVEENAVQAMARDLGERRIGFGLDALLLRLQLAPDPDHEQSIGPQMQRRAHRRDLAHRTVAEKLAINVSGRKYEWQCRGRHQMLQPDGGRYADAARAVPRLESGNALVEGHGLAGSVARARYAESVEMTLVDRTLHAAEIEPRAEQFGKRGVVEQRNRRLSAEAAGEGGRHPFAAVLQNTQRVGAVDMMDVKVLPHRHQLADTLPEVAGIGGEHGGVESAGRGPADDGERARRIRRQHFGNRAQDADLVRGARAAARQDEADLRRLRTVAAIHPLCPLPHALYCHTAPAR